MPDVDFLRPVAFFDFNAHPFAHQKLFLDGDKTVIDVLDSIGEYCCEWLKNTEHSCCLPARTPPQRCHAGDAVRIFANESAVVCPDRIIGGEGHTLFVEAGVRIIAGTIDLSAGSVYIGAKTTIEGAWICGSTIIGEKTTIRPGAYIRGNTIIGDNCTIRGEIKNSVVMNDADFPHPSYLGDSLCGWHSHFGNQATAANVNIFGRKTPLSVTYKGERIPLNRRKIGIVMGDECQVGCNSVSDPATFLLPRTIVYSLSRITSGVYGPDEVIKNKPMAHGVIERAPLQPE